MKKKTTVVICVVKSFLISIVILSFLISSSFAKEASIHNASKYILHIPSGLSSYKKYPLVIALSPSGDAQSMINTWKDVSEKHKWIIFASKEYRNGPDMNMLISNIVAILDDLFSQYPIDRYKIIATGFSGGGMGSHFFSYLHPDMISAVVINTGMMHEYQIEKKYSCPRGKLAVFLASPGDFRYLEMKRDRRFLENLGWRTKWIEFGGGHTIAPASSYEEAAQWLKRLL